MPGVVDTEARRLDANGHRKGQAFAAREVAPVLLDLARVCLDTVWLGGCAAAGTHAAGEWNSASCPTPYPSTPPA